MQDGRVSETLPPVDGPEITPADAAVRLLTPLRARYASWLQLEPDDVVQDRDEDPTAVRAMQMIIRMERDRPPSWHAALRLAASGAAAICLDPRLDTERDWAEAVADYAAGHIRKVTRRARGAPWAATAALPGLSLADNETELRVLRPGLVSELDKRVGKLQVGGTDAPIDDPPNGPVASTDLQVWVPPEPVMTLGKAMAQAGHAGMIAAALIAESDPEALGHWYRAGCPADVRRATTTIWQELVGAVGDPERGWHDAGLLAVRDAGFTEIAPGTITMIARRPRTGRP